MYCGRCGTRPHWPLAERSCSGTMHVTKRYLEKHNAALVSQNEAINEPGRSLDLHGSNPAYALHPPCFAYGRDGRRRTGI